MVFAAVEFVSLILMPPLLVGLFVSMSTGVLLSEVCEPSPVFLNIMSGYNRNNDPAMAMPTAIVPPINIASFFAKQEKVQQ